MARQLSVERSADRIIMRRVQAGELISESVSESAVRLWVNAWQPEGLRGLATADAILTASDVDVAAAVLTPWTELTPPPRTGPSGGFPTTPS